MLLISAGFMEFNSKSPANGIPSTTYKGERLPSGEPYPLTRTVATVPGWPDVFITVTPATSPANAWETFENDFASMFSALIVTAEPVKDCFVEVP